MDGESSLPYPVRQITGQAARFITVKVESIAVMTVQNVS
jgi:hypothetical protein